MRKIQKLLSLVMLMAVMGSYLLSPAAKVEAADVLTPYREKLAELNTKLRTDYDFASEEQLAETGESYADIVAFYTDMTMEEFEAYVMDAYQKNIAAEDQSSPEVRAIAAGNMSQVVDVADPNAYTSTQRYYYHITDYNNLYITSVCYTGDGERYSNVNSYGESHTAYPYYKPSSMNVSYNTGRTKVTCTFHCYKFLAKGISDNELHAVIVTFTAGGGNLYKA